MKILVKNASFKMLKSVDKFILDGSNYATFTPFKALEHVGDSFTVRFVITSYESSDSNLSSYKGYGMINKGLDTVRICAKMSRTKTLYVSIRDDNNNWASPINDFKSDSVYINTKISITTSTINELTIKKEESGIRLYVKGIDVAIGEILGDSVITISQAGKYDNNGPNYFEGEILSIKKNNKDEISITDLDGFYNNIV